MLLVIIGKAATATGGPFGPYGPWLTIANEWVIILLLFILGWHSFGFIVQPS